MGLGLARGSLLATIVALPALAADPYPNQPGVLGAEEIRAATAALKTALPADASLPLVASGKRPAGYPLPAYAVFAAAPERVSEGATEQRRVLCATSEASPAWRCTPHSFHVHQLPESFHAFASSHAFVYRTEDVPRNQALPGEIFHYFNICFNAHYGVLTGLPYPHPVPAIATVVESASGITVTAGPAEDRDNLQLVRQAEAKPPCGTLTLRSARLGKLSQATSDKVRAVMAKLELHSRGAEERRQREEKFRRNIDRLTDLCIWVNVLTLPLAILLPFAWLLARGRRSVVGISALVGAVSLSSAMGVLWFLELARMPDAGHSLLIVIPATFITLVICGVWVAVGLTAPRPEKV